MELVERFSNYAQFKIPNFSALVYSFSILPLKSVQVYLRISTDDVVSQPTCECMEDMNSITNSGIQHSSYAVD